MKNFEEFMRLIVSLNGDLPKGMNTGLSGPLSNRETGDLAEQAVLRRLDKINYEAYITPGSKSPADIFAVKRRQGYWHIMLIQVKSSGRVDTIKKLNAAKIDELNKLAKFVKDRIKSIPLMKDYADKSVLISTGYAGIHSSETKSGLRNLIKETILYSVYRSNFSNHDIRTAKGKAEVAHYL